MKANQLSQNVSKNFFHMPDFNGFTPVELTLLDFAIEDQERYLLYAITADAVSDFPGDRARQLYEIAHDFERVVLKSNDLSLRYLEYEPFRDILGGTIGTIDCFKIARELLKQYEEKINKDKAA